uniref:Uncharacterized protein n=1 Tax=Romanomermis culicivorax TaxID=13658 RepID=A0A915K7N0_ROMCU
MKAEIQKPNPRRGRPRKTAAVRRTKKTVAEGSSGDQANPDDVIGTIGRKPRTRRVKTTSVQRVGRRRTAVEKADDGKKEIRGRKAKIFIPDLDLESVNRAQSFELLAKIFDREARRERRRLNRHNNKEVVVAAPSPPTTGDDNCLVGESSIKEPPTVFQVRAESGDVVSLEKTIVNENPESNATNREEDTAV